jgi:hypothetical protein
MTDGIFAPFTGLAIARRGESFSFSILNVATAFRTLQGPNLLVKTRDALSSNKRLYQSDLTLDSKEIL